jgi:hypothetical protein
MVPKQFYKDILEWIETGEPASDTFSSNVGLCSSLLRWLGDDPKPYVDLLQDFKDAGLCFNYPFCSYTMYACEQLAGSIYTNPKRLEWIKDHAAN